MLRIGTLNIWFDNKLRAARTRALIVAIKQLNLDICCLQEVIPEVALEIMNAFPGWSCSDPGDGSSVAPYGVMAMVAPGTHARMCFHDLPTNMCRRLLVIECGNITVATVHLESLNNHPTRTAQLLECRRLLAPFEDVLLVGDFNFDSERNFQPPHRPLENEALGVCLPDYVDVWPALRSDRGLTFDSTNNPYIPRPEHMRYDRVMSRTANWRAIRIERFGHESFDHLVELSAQERDHLERPPTPPRPVAKCSPDPFSLGIESETHLAQMLKVASESTYDSPRQEQTPFLLSDHFGLFVEIQRVDGCLS
eukprot:TRINITY_DN33530_c0_g1_i1.p1 TRINITY_DN33530_c0_g1~~TRINITY_DN33530_c0_g1_i1.p1  ORF type:complete len:309 (-),score=32.46 TRINITY_DN33530_c0_g1_i1:183-1109(-)